MTSETDELCKRIFDTEVPGSANGIVIDARPWHVLVICGAVVRHGHDPMTPDPYEICRRIRHYHQKNGYAPKRGELEHWCGLLPIAEHGAPIAAVLTEKGFRMAERSR